MFGWLAGEHQQHLESGIESASPADEYYWLRLTNLLTDWLTDPPTTVQIDSWPGRWSGGHGIGTDFAAVAAVVAIVTEVIMRKPLLY